MSPWSLEARVGVFVLAALVLLTGFVLALGDVSFSRGRTLFADFAYAGSLQEGAPVKVSGIRVGRIAHLRLLDPRSEPPPAAPVIGLGRARGPLVRAELSLDAAAQPFITEGLRVAVSTQGLIGEAYIELSPGEGGALLADRAAVRGIDAPDIQMMILQIAALVDALGILATGSGTAEPGSLGSLVSTLSEVVGVHRAELGQAIADAAVAAATLRAILTDARASLGRDRLGLLLGDAEASAAVLRQELPALLNRASEVMSRLESLSARADRTLDEKTLATTVGDLRAAADNLARLSGEGRSMLARIERGEGSVGGLVKDPQVYDDLKEMIRDLRLHPWKVLWRD